MVLCVSLFFVCGLCSACVMYVLGECVCVCVVSRCGLRRVYGWCVGYIGGVAVLYVLCVNLHVVDVCGTFFSWKCGTCSCMWCMYHVCTFCVA